MAMVANRQSTCNTRQSEVIDQTFPGTAILRKPRLSYQDWGQETGYRNTKKHRQSGNAFLEDVTLFRPVG